MAVTMNARWDNNGTVIPGGDAEYVVAEQPIAEYDNWFNYNIVADIQAVIDDVINKFNANTILKADTDNTPAALVVAEQTIVGRKTGNSIAALTDTEVRTILNVEDGSTADQTDNEIRDAVEAAADSNTFTDADHAIVNDAMVEAVFNSNTVVKADSDNTPVALTVAEQTLVGRITAGVITALTATQVRTLINVADGADVTGSNTPQSHNTSHYNDGSDTLVTFNTYIIGNEVLAWNPVVVDTNSAAYVKAKGFILGTGLSATTLRVAFDMASGTDDSTSYARVYRNSVAVGTEQSVVNLGGGAYAEKTEDITGWSNGDLLDVYVKNGTAANVYVRNLEIRGVTTDLAPATIND